MLDLHQSPLADADTRLGPRDSQGGQVGQLPGQLVSVVGGVVADLRKQMPMQGLPPCPARPPRSFMES